MKVLTVVLLAFVQASNHPVKDFIEGFLSGFGNKEIDLGEQCMQQAWFEHLEELTSDIWDNIMKKDYMPMAVDVLELYNEILSGAQACRLQDIIADLEKIIDHDLPSVMVNVYGHWKAIAGEVQASFETKDTRIIGEHVGTLFRYIVVGDPEIDPLIEKEAFVKLSLGFL